MPKFTIGIPTYNRAKWIGNAIECALGQTYRDVEVIVSDNASTDSTADVVRKFGNRVRYIRNETNIGAARNFCKLVELATGEYFSWLQDDDSIFPYFAERAVHCFDAFPDARAVAAYAVATPDVMDLSQGQMYGPPISLDWIHGRPRSVRGDLIIGLSLSGWVSFAIPPVIAFRMNAISDYVQRWNHAIPLLVERTMLADVVAHGELVIDPYVAGVFRLHAEQCSRLMLLEDGALRREWLQMVRELDAIVPGRGRDWTNRFRELLDEVIWEHQEELEQESRSWPNDIALCREVRDVLVAKVRPAAQAVESTG